VAKSAVPVLAYEREEAAVLLVFDESVLSRLLACESADFGRLLLLCKAGAGELRSERCTLLDEVEKPALHLPHFSSRASPASVRTRERESTVLGSSSHLAQ
jgi:hypothetical protein